MSTTTETTHSHSDKNEQSTGAMEEQFVAGSELNHDLKKLNYPRLSPDSVMRLQPIIGNQAIMRMIQRLKPAQFNPFQLRLKGGNPHRATTPLVQREEEATEEATTAPAGAGTATTTPTPEETPSSNLRDWPTLLPTVTRTKAQKITKVKDEAKINVPDVEIPDLTPAQSDIVKKIAENRAGLSPALEKIKMKPYNKDKQAGYFYNGNNSNKMKTDKPTGKDEKRNKVIDAIRTEIGREGGWSAVNSYDDAVVTLGRGFTRTMLAKVMQTFFALDPDAKNTFLDLGITWSGDTAHVVNTATGGIESGDNALRLIQLEPQILSVFVQLAESEEHGGKLITAQEKHTQAYKVPQTVIDNWSDIMAIRLVAHLIHWRSAKEWKDYADCKDDVRKILMVAIEAINKGKVDSILKTGAFILTQEQTKVLFSFAEGKVKKSVFGPVKVNLEDDALKGEILFKASEDGKYYCTSRIGESQ